VTPDTDHGWTIQKRQYKDMSTTLSRIGASDFDKAGKIMNLKFNLRGCAKHYRDKLKTRDADVIEKRIKQGIVKDVVRIVERNDARKYAAKMAQCDDFKSDGAYADLDIARSSKFGGSNSNYSPTKSMVSMNSSPRKVMTTANLQSALKKPSTLDTKTATES
jgi:hypothetical protein